MQAFADVRLFAHVCVYVCVGMEGNTFHLVTKYLKEYDCLSSAYTNATHCFRLSVRSLSAVFCPYAIGSCSVPCHGTMG